MDIYIYFVILFIDIIIIYAFNISITNKLVYQCIFIVHKYSEKNPAIIYSVYGEIIYKSLYFYEFLQFVTYRV